MDGPAGHLLFGNLFQFLADPLSFLTNASERYGDVVKLRMPGPAYLLNSPNDVGQVLSDRQGVFLKGRGIQSGRRLLGNGLLTSEGAHHKRQARMIGPSLQPDRLLRHLTGLKQLVEDGLKVWEGTDRVNVVQTMSELTRSMADWLLFSGQLQATAGLGAAFETCLQYMRHRTFSPWPWFDYLPTAAHRNYRSAIAQLEGTIYALMTARRTKTDDQDDMLSWLMTARDEQGQPMTDLQVRDEAITMLLGATESTATTLAWACHLVAAHPEFAQKIRLEEAEGEGPLRPFTDRVFSETLRLYPPPWLIPRQTAQRATLPSGAELPAGCQLFISPYVLQRSPRYFPEPEKFNPDRFMESPPAYTYLPFGAGSRGCIGERWARLQANLVLRILFSTYELALAPGQKVVAEPVVTLRPRGGQLWMLPQLRSKV